MSMLRVSSLAVIALLAAACTQETGAYEGTEDAPGETAEAAESLLGFPLPGGGNPLLPATSPLLKELYQIEAKGWLKWGMGLPFSTGPITDTTGAACHQGQSGPVFYLAGTTGGDVTRNCTISRGDFLFLPLVNRWVIPTAEQVDTPEELADYLSFVNDYIPAQRPHTCHLHISLDGQPLLTTEADLDEKLWAQVLKPFSVTLNDDNFASQYGRPGGVSPAAVTAGHYALLRPLSHGNHVLEFGGAVCDDDDSIVFETSATYHLTVTH
ncbi:Hypothetical protein A7982_06148 [Minicystis rosea]|nr:Hypothetical protein A7982_06148 [Minicystis rosea]